MSPADPGGPDRCDRCGVSALTPAGWVEVSPWRNDRGDLFAFAVLCGRCAVREGLRNPAAGETPPRHSSLLRTLWRACRLSGRLTS